MKVVEFSERNLEKLVLAAVSSLKKGKVLVCPTDTIYGFVANAQNPKAVEKVFRIKRRSKTKPLGIFVEDLAAAKKLARISSLQAKLLKKVWPGKITAVLCVKKRFPVGIGTQNTIGIRVPKHKFVNLILKQFNHGLAQTSVNIADTPPLQRVADMVRVFGKRKVKPDFIFDAGKLPASRPSKIVDMTGEKTKIIRT